MKVRELIQLLEGQDPDGEVTIVTEPARLPMEHELAGMVLRSDLLDDDGDPGTAACNVVLVEGTWCRHRRRRARGVVR